MSLRDAVIKLAYQEPALRSELLRALRRAEGPKFVIAIDLRKRARTASEAAATDLPDVPEIEGLVFPETLFTQLWYEDEDGNRLEFTEDMLSAAKEPEGAHTQQSQFPNYLVHSVLLLTDEGSKEAFRGESGWPVDLVTEMVRSGDWDAGNAILVAGQSCGRCMNVLAHHYGCGWGFAFGSEEYWEHNTCCKMCIPVAGDPHPTPTPEAGG